MAFCFNCFKPFRDEDHLQEERLKAFKEFEEIQAGIGIVSAGGDLKTPDIAATVTKKGDKLEYDIDEKPNLETSSSVDGEQALEQLEKPVEPIAEVATQLSFETDAPIADEEATSSGGEVAEAHAVDGPGDDDAGGQQGDDIARSVCSPSCTATAVTASCSEDTSSASGGGGGGDSGSGDGGGSVNAPTTAPILMTPTPLTTAKQAESPTSTNKNGWALHDSPWYPPGPNIIRSPRGSPRGSGSGSGKSVSGVASSGFAAGSQRQTTNSPGPRSFGDGPSTEGKQLRNNTGVIVPSRYMRMYGGSMGLPVGRTTTPPPLGVFTSASTRLALHDVLHHRSKGLGGAGGAGRGGLSVSGLANIDFRPQWRY
ncbi:hypothetical protein Vafri_14219 [Volvox africanus]|uniref:Uncharacterized protein n=1 Tax=Volvox africanus TaxID=51714 RepID=A0A8J4BDW4_9CHLO|nr:hypothetical protein Vafri_14219 [Volvox africanus]